MTQPWTRRRTVVRANTASFQHLPEKMSRERPAAEHVHAIVQKATTEFSEGERADVAWIQTEAIDLTKEVVVAPGFRDDIFKANAIVTFCSRAMIGVRWRAPAPRPDPIDEFLSKARFTPLSEIKKAIQNGLAKTDPQAFIDKAIAAAIERLKGKI